MTGKKRHILDKALELLELFPVVAIIGARQTGKTTLAKQLRPNWQYFDIENPRDFELISHDPNLFFTQHPRHIILDEAQEYPDLFKVLRGVIDNKRDEKGRFILTGSSSPRLLSSISESLAGRIATIELGTLKVSEIIGTKLSNFYNIFSQELTKESLQQSITKKPAITLPQIQKYWYLGGYPEPVLADNINYYRQWMENYRDTYINRDISLLFPKLNKTVYQRFCVMLSKLSGTILNKRDLARALEVSETTVKEYIKIIDGTFIWRQLPSFEKNIIKSVIKMPKGYIRDSGLLHWLLGISSPEKLYEHPSVGASFESFVIEELIKGLQATMVTNWEGYYYRTRNGAEIDFILDGPFGTLPIEIKYGSHTPMKQLKSLTMFIQEHDLPYGLLLNQATEATWLTQKIFQLPVTWL
jgi:predicted AAA+ superfamily ATPase